MRRIRIALLLAVPLLCSVLCSAQLSRLIQPYQAQEIAPARTTDSPRIQGLLRAGKLYLSLRDAIALAIENNLDLEIDRYGPLLTDWALKRAEAGGAVRGVQSGNAQISSVNSGLGANGSTLAANLGNGGVGNGNNGTGGATVQQIGQITPNLDPNLQSAGAFSHQTQPQVNSTVSQTSSLIQAKHTYNTILRQGFLSGGVFQITDYEQSLKENSPRDVVNPAVGPYIAASLQHPLLRGFGVRLNDRLIRIGKLNLTGARETFRSQLLDLVSSVVNQYWDLASANDEVKARRQALDIAQKFYDDTKAQIQIGSLAQVELPRAQVEIAARNQDLLIAESTVRQRENQFRQVLSSVEDPVLDAAGIVPLDRIDVPQTDDLPPLRELVAEAMQKRPDVAVSKIRDETLQISSLGTVNPLLPTLNVNLQAYDRGTAGTYQPSSGTAANPQFLGGYGTALKQIFQRDFPSESLQVTFSAPLLNRSAQADYGIDQLQLRQSTISGQRDNNAIVVAISNQLIALRQARARYSAAINTRELQQQLLTAEQQKFSFGKSTTSNLIIAQRALVTAQTSEINAQAAYAHARVSLDQVLGTTLEVNHVSLEQALGP